MTDLGLKLGMQSDFRKDLLEFDPRSGLLNGSLSLIQKLQIRAE